MLFWIATAFITFLVTAGVLYPLTRGHGTLSPESDYDREIYKARIEEIDNDLSIERISTEEADAAKAEEGRRLIASTQPDSSAKASTTTSSNKWAVVGSVVFLPLFTIAVYMLSGTPDLPDQTLAARLSADPERQSIVNLLERAEMQLVKNPDDGRGWAVVAPVYLRLGRIDDAINAYRNTIRLLGDNPSRLSSLGEVLVISSQGVVTDEALGFFKRAANSSPENVKSRFFLALALGQNGEPVKAVSAWEKLLANATDQAPWVPVAKANLEAQRGLLGIKSKPPSTTAELPGPSQGDIQAAGQMDAAARTSMIEGMVANLAAKLDEDPKNEAGWRRLIRSYGVLGKSDDARQAIAKARLALPDNAEFQKHLDEVEKSVLNKDGVTQ
ncbi:MAG: c-type cytochrome biogenesis protein CcmI [Rhizobiaceae bacterium]